jgi:hypothetical protein
MSLWEFRCVVEGYVAANSADDGKSLSANEQDELADWMGI